MEYRFEVGFSSRHGIAQLHKQASQTSVDWHLSHRPMKAAHLQDQNTHVDLILDNQLCCWCIERK